MLIYEQVFEMLRKGGVVMPVIFAVGWLAWILENHVFCYFEKG